MHRVRFPVRHTQNKTVSQSVHKLEFMLPKFIYTLNISGFFSKSRNQLQTVVSEKKIAEAFFTQK